MARQSKWQDLRDESVLERIEKGWQNFHSKEVAVKPPVKIKRHKPFTPMHEYYIKCIETYTLTFCTGPAGTAKTYWAAERAITMLEDPGRPIEKIIITRPMQGCGKTIGLLPGDKNDKFAPVTRSITDRMLELIDKKTLKEYLAQEKIEIYPMEFMRGASFNNCFVICDEMQNASEEEIKMLLTRIGDGCKMVLCGDTRQSDLGTNRECPIIDIIRKVRTDIDVANVKFTADDIVRSGIVKRLIMLLEA